jgi:hypothetical protein
MNLSKLDLATIAVVVSGAVWLGTLQGTVNTLLLDREQIKEERETALNDINAEKERMLAEIVKAQQELKRLRDKAPISQQATEDIAKAQQEFNALAQAVQVTKADIAKAQQEVSGINRQRDQAVADILSAKQGAISDFQNSLSSAEEKLNALNQALFVLQDEIAQAQQKFSSSINSQRDKALAEIKSAKQQAISSVEERVNALLALAQHQVESHGEKAVKAEQSDRSSLRFIDNGDGTVTDNRTGLIWLKNANCFCNQDWWTAMKSANNLAYGYCGLIDGRADLRLLVFQQPRQPCRVRALEGRRRERQRKVYHVLLCLARAWRTLRI